MPDSTTSESESDFVCDCKEEEMRSACIGEPFYKEHEGKRYCLLHFPGKEKSAAFQVSLQRKLDAEDFNFSGVWFPGEASFSQMNFTTDADFSSATFSGDADFTKTTFSANATFYDAIFNGNANFWSAVFSAEATFCGAKFSPEGYAEFIGATFKEADFSTASFGADANFILATFTAADFSNATFADRARFEGDENTTIFAGPSSLNLQFAEFKIPDHVSFQTLTLHPHWFVNVDARKFNFINVHWNSIGRAKQEIDLLESEAVWSTHRLLAISCRKLAANAEDNDRYREASHFRRMAMDAERLETCHGFGFWKLSWWYWMASGYGERSLQALIVLLAIWLAFAAFDTRVGFARWEPKLASEADAVSAKRDVVGSPLEFGRALAYSAGVMTLQKPEPRPATTAAQTIVLLETILGPVQAALLALAIRRKFMR
jgi:uncharacterized protein YjbI with pentapeptide repeats